MRITKVNIINYKCFEGKFTIDFHKGINIIVGNNETGKSTILEAVHLALTGVINGKYIRNELNQYLFNNNVVQTYLKSLLETDKLEPPKIIIEVFFSNDLNPKFEGNNNFERIVDYGVVFKIELDDDYKQEYETLLKNREGLTALPIEYYKTSWYSFSQEPMTAKTIPIKSVLIDSSSIRYQNSSDVYIARIIQNDLDDKEKVLLSQAYREMKETFGENKSVININNKIKDKTRITNKMIKISAELPTQSAWETALMTFVDDVPFQQIGKGEQCIIKTNLALSHSKDKEASLLLLEEPENHLAYSKMNELVFIIEKYYIDKQIIITTHSSFIANKLDLKNIILLNRNTIFRLDKLNEDTYNFFKKLAGYPTLRLLLCKKAVLVEGDSDELIFQKAYYTKHERLPIQNGIDVISVGLSFRRFLEIAIQIKINVAVITDNDSNYEEKVIKKYKEYEDCNDIKIFYDTNNELNTLEPQFINVNKDLERLCNVIGIDFNKFNDFDKINEYMVNHKTAWALKIFETQEEFVFPKYIMNAVDWCDE
ncbi:MAG: AAA family ATPase [Dysgonamonadaceae bacterium]|jgi:putative ATP-dependent endonuclease of OLD family|nr:AAA family ATPase [Dysgonamonadaceae bacterium]